MNPRRSHRRALLAAALCATALAIVPAAAQAGGTSYMPKVMTRNLYLGADLTPAQAALGLVPGTPACAPQPTCVLLANLTVWNQVVATNFPARAKLLAKEIDDADPYLVGLQEVALWRSGPINFTKDAATVDYDFLDSLLTELTARGSRYTAAVTQQEADVETPAADGKDHRLTMRDVILVRTDLPSWLFSTTNPQGQNYANFLSFTTGSPYGPIEFKRGWTSVDVKVLGHPVLRFVNTHLESAASGFRQAQAAELVGAFSTGPLLDVSRPAILAGDLNSDSAIPYLGNPASGASDGAALAIITGAGFVDTPNTQNTFGHDADLLDFPSNTFTERIDHILTRPGIDPRLVRTKVVGTDPANRTPGGLWPSDHGGVIAGLG